MPTQKTIAEIIQIAKMSVPIALNKIGEDMGIFGKSPDRWIGIKIFAELQSVEFLYDNFPSENFTRAAANYLYDLCFPYNKQAEAVIENLSGLPPQITGPSNVSKADGETASFTIDVSSTSAYTVQWYRGNVLISGATSNTYSFTASNADDGAQFHAVATNPAGSTISSIAILTVTTQSVGSYYVGDNDYFSALNGGTDAITYNGTFNIINGQPLSATIADPAGTLGNNKYHVYKYPTAQGLKTTWYNTDMNKGSINDQVFRQVVTIGDYYYIISRTAISVDTSVPMIFT